MPLGIQKVPVIPCTVSKPNIDSDDPLRDLVLCSNDKSKECESTKLNALAVKAANLTVADELQVKPTTTIKSLAGIFAGTETFVRKVEETVKKKYAALDPTDSEGIGGQLNNNNNLCQL